MVLSRQSNKLTSTVSVLAITISLVAAQSATQKSVAQFATTPAAAPATLSINGAGAGSVNSLFVGTGATNACPFGSKGSWFNVFGTGNPPSLNANVPPNDPTIPAAPSPFPSPCPSGFYATGDYGPVISANTFRYANVGSGSGIDAFFNPPGSFPLGSTTPVVVPTSPNPGNNTQILDPISFAGSDDPLQGADIERVAAGNSAHRSGSGKAIQVPVIGVGIALPFNDPSINQPAAGLKISRKSFCGIFTGNITNWSDASIRADNGGAIVSSSNIVVVVRSDVSGSTFILSNALNHICKTAATPGLPTTYVWNKGVGSIPVFTNSPPTPLAANTVYWPAAFQAASVSGGGAVATKIINTPNAIGYVDSATRLSRSLLAALLQNKSGAYVGPTVAGIQHALTSPNTTVTQYGAAPANRLIRVDVSDPSTSTAYSISGVTYTLFYDQYANSTIACHLKSFVYWALADSVSPFASPYPQVFPSTPAISGGCPAPTASNPSADKIAVDRGYAPLPNAIKLQARTVVNNFVNTTSP